MLLQPFRGGSLLFAPLLGHKPDAPHVSEFAPNGSQPNPGSDMDRFKYERFNATARPDGLERFADRAHRFCSLKLPSKVRPLRIESPEQNTPPLHQPAVFKQGWSSTFSGSLH